MDEKRRIDVEIAGLKMSLVTDETESFVESVVRRVNDTMNSLLQSSKNRTRLDAALLCALDFCSDKLTAEKRVRNLEAQISLYDANLRRFREENIALREKLEALGEKTEAPAVEEIPEKKEEKPRSKAAEKKADPKAEAPEQIPLEGAAKDEARAARLRAIEELLGRGKK